MTFLGLKGTNITLYCDELELCVILFCSLLSIDESGLNDYVTFIRALSHSELIAKCSILLPEYNHQDVSVNTVPTS